MVESISFVPRAAWGTFALKAFDRKARKELPQGSQSKS
jgi:hypothetical protein